MYTLRGDWGKGKCFLYLYLEELIIMNSTCIIYYDSQAFIAVKSLIIAQFM